MRGRRLAAVDELVAIVSPDGERVAERLRGWATDRGLGVRTVPVGDDVDIAEEERLGVLGITIGGDGTFLEGVKQFAPQDVPVLGVNEGTLAFLARVDPDELPDALDEAVQGRATLDAHLQFRVRGPDLDATGINDVVLETPPLDTPVDRKITKLDVFADGEFVGEYDGTGVAVATPTGSTGLALSAGGPVHDPRNNATLQVVPLQTHKMGVRPLVVDAETTIDIVAKRPARLQVDGGREHVAVDAGERVRVDAADTAAEIVRTSYDEAFYRAIGEKLGWGVRDDPPEQTPRPPDRAGRRGGDDESHLEHARRVATEAVESVGEPLRELHGRIESVTFKSDAADVVTRADYLSENVLTTALENEFPTHNIRSEEDVRIDRDGRYTWLIDPLDGTGNYANGNPNYCVSVALLDGDTPVVGVVYAPETDERWTAIRGGTARRDGRPISTTDRTAVAESVLLSGYDPDGTFLTHFYQEARGVRRLGATALHLCYLASGSVDAIWEYDTYPWDVAAGAVIAETAGASLTDADGAPFAVRDTDRRTPLVGTNGDLHEAVLSRIDGHERLSQ